MNCAENSDSPYICRHRKTSGPHSVPAIIKQTGIESATSSNLHRQQVILFTMSKDTASIAPSEATTMVDEPESEQRTSILGEPIKRDHHDHYTSMMMADGGGFGMGASGANLLPPGFTDRSLVRIPIRMSDVYPNEIQQPAKKKSFFGKSSSAKEEIKVVMMSRGDYLRYWVKGNDGKFAASVIEPQEGRRAWYENQLAVNEEWIRNDPSLANNKGSTQRAIPFSNLGDAIGGAIS